MNPTSSMSLEELLSSFRGIRTVALCAHVNPDGDALGSSLALAELLRAYGCEATCLLAQNQPAPALYDFLEGYEFTSASVYTAAPDLFIALDTPTLSRLGDGVAVFERSAKTICIDHHPDYSGFAGAYYGNHEAAATSSLIWSIIKGSGLDITQGMANCCYVGLMTDTGCFSFQNTNERAFRDAAEMVACGVDPSRMSMNVYESKSTGALKLESRLIERLRFSPDNAIVYSWVDEHDLCEFDINRDDTEGLPTLLRSIAGAQVAMLLRVEKGGVRANLRSRGSCDVGELARRFGGGGHQAAAGVTLNESLDDAIAILLDGLGKLDSFKKCCAAPAVSGVVSSAASPVASPMDSPAAAGSSGVASPAASPVASPVASPTDS